MLPRIDTLGGSHPCTTTAATSSPAAKMPAASESEGLAPKARFAGRAVPVHWLISPLESSTSLLAEALCPAPDGLVPFKSRCLCAVGSNQLGSLRFALFVTRRSAKSRED